MLSTMTERFIWTVTYQDGSTLSEYPNPDTHVSFRDVRVEDVVQLEVAPNHWLGETCPAYLVPIHPEDVMRPIMFRTVALNAHTGESARWNVFGFQLMVNGRNSKTLTYLPDHGQGPIVLTDRTMEVG
ncbi:MAG: hypothetical protein ACR2OE_07485 [Thermomicrobiales bacterium]